MAKATPKTPIEAVNSEQLDALEAGRAGAEATPGAPSTGELEEKLAEAEDRAIAMERENAALKATIESFNERMAALEKIKRQDRQAASGDDLLPGEEPVFDENEPHGVVVGDLEIAYVQNGYQFGRDRKFITREKNRGVPRAFNPRLVGHVKPRPGQVAFDPLEGIRGKE